MLIYRPDLTLERTSYVYTDASYDHGVAGWAVVRDGECILQDWSRGLTSNLAEGRAILDALKLLKKTSMNIEIRSDSSSWVSSLNTRKPVRGRANRTIYDEAVSLLRPNILLNWIPGHRDEYPEHIFCDELAGQARIHKITQTHPDSNSSSTHPWKLQ